MRFNAAFLRFDLSISFKFFLLFLAISATSIGISSARAAQEGTLGWRWDGQYYPTAVEACRAQWEGLGMNNGYSRFIGDRANEFGGNAFLRVCEWTSFQYLCRAETGGGIQNCGTILPGSVTFNCASGYSKVFPYSCIKTTDLLPERRVCQPGTCCDSNPNPTAGNPIILSTGTKFHQTEDFSTADGKLAVARTYRSTPFGKSTSAKRTPFGLPRGWQFNFSMELHLSLFYGSPASPNAQTTLLAPDGAAYDFALASDGQWKPVGTASSEYYKLEFIGTLPSNLSQLQNAPSQWRVTGPDDRKWTLETLGRVNFPTSKFHVAQATQVVDPSGYTWTYAYDATDQRLLSITDTYGRALSFVWNYFYLTSVSGVANSLPVPEAVSRITLPDGASIEFQYDPTPASVGPSTSAIERLIGVKWKNASSVVVDSETYHYEDADYRYALTGITDNRGIRVSTYAYDRRGRTISTAGAAGSNIHTVEYGESGTTRTRRVTNPLGKKTLYNFSAAADGIRLTSLNGEASTNCVPSNSSFTYSTTGYVATRTDEEGRITTYIRDAKGRPTQIKEATGTSDERLTNVVWHATFNLPESIARPGLTTTYTYNASGQMTARTETDTTTHTVPYATSGQTRMWTYAYTPSGQLQSVDGPVTGPGDTISYTYDANGYVATSTNEVGHVYTVLAKNGRGLPTQIQDPNGVIENLTYDARGRLLSSTIDPAGANAQTLLEYDAAGNVTKITEPNGAFLAFEYDGNDRVTKQTNALGDAISFTYDAMGNVTLRETRNNAAALYYRDQRIYDELGRLLRTVRAGSATWAYGYDKVGNQLSVTDPNSNVASRTYDKLDRLKTFADERTSMTTWAYGATDQPASTTDPRSVTTTYVRNGWGEAIREQSNDIGSIVYERDQRGNVTKRTDARGVVADLTFDNAGRLLTVVYPGEAASNITNSYDSGANGIGRLTGVTDAAGTLMRGYDKLGRITQEVRTIGAVTYTTGYQWDAAGKLTQISYPSGRIVNYGRDVNGNVENVHTQASSSSASVGVAWWVSHTPFGPRHGLLHGNELTDWRTYDQDGRLVTQALRDETVTPANGLIDRWYGYTDNRNLTAIVDNLDASRNESYWYTPNGFLQNADGPWGGLVFYADGVGNITHRILTVGSATTTDNFFVEASSNRLSQTLTNGTQSRVFASDAAGNIVTDTNTATSVTRTYGYNAPGQLASATVGSAMTGQYAYDYLSRLTVRSLPASASTLHYVHDPDGNIIAEHDGSGTVVREYIWLDERPLAVVADAGSASPEIYQVHTDHLERPIMMTDASKNIVWRATYLPYGGLHTVLGSATLDQRFPGQWFQLESGLHYNWHRHYDPATGRYLQPDPLGMPDGPGRWTYVTNSPLMKIDPMGLAEIKGFGGHALSRMQLRGITPRAVYDACTCPLSVTPQPNGNTMYTGASCTVILSPNGWVVTVW